jgi:WD repeat-containing protein mio
MVPALIANAARSFTRPLTSFALVPSSTVHPLTTNIMLVNKDGDLELHALYDTPKPTSWSMNGDLIYGAGLQYQVISGVLSEGDNYPTVNEEQALASRGRATRSESRFLQTDGLLQTNGLPTTPASPRLHNGNDSRSPGTISTTTLRKPTSRPVLAKTTAHSPKRKTYTEKMQKIMQQVVEQDISMVIRERIKQGYSLTNVGFITSPVPMPKTDIFFLASHYLMLGSHAKVLGMMHLCQIYGIGLIVSKIYLVLWIELQCLAQNHVAF